jgi:DNA-binding MarR family transcriptional regulator
MAAIEKNTLIQKAMFLLGDLNHIYDLQKRASWNELSLTIGQLKSLFFIDFEGCTSMKKLAGSLGMASPNVTAIVDYLVKEKLVSRVKDPDDRRRLKLEITNRGKSLLANLRAGDVMEISTLLPLLGEQDLEHLTDGLKALAIAARSQQGKHLRCHEIANKAGEKPLQERNTQNAGRKQTSYQSN